MAIPPPLGHRPQQPPHPTGHWAPVPPSTPNPKKPVGLVVGVGVGALVLGLMIGAAGSNPEPTAKAKPAPTATVTETVTPKPEPKPSKKPKPEPNDDKADEPPVKMAARIATNYTPGVLADEGTKHVGIEVDISNNGNDEINVNQMYFAAKDTKGYKHDAEFAGTGNDAEIGHARLAPGENVKGIVAFKGDFTPAKIEFNDAGFGTTYSAPVK